MLSRHPINTQPDLISEDSSSSENNSTSTAIWQLLELGTAEAYGGEEEEQTHASDGPDADTARDLEKSSSTKGDNVPANEEYKRDGFVISDDDEYDEAGGGREGGQRGAWR